MKERMRRKLHSPIGESIAETLIALLISALALLMLAGAVGSAQRVVSRSKAVMEDYYAANALMANLSGETDDMGGKYIQGSAAVTISIENSSVAEYDDNFPVAYAVAYYENVVLASTPVISFHLSTETTEGGVTP